MENKRGSWGSSFGFLMAAVGSAVGLGNIWGFPYKMGANGGFAFLLVYIVLAIFMGFPLLLTELAMGRKTGKSVVDTYKTLCKPFGWVGWLAAIVPFLILSFYSVLGAYTLQYTFLNLSNLSFGSAGVDGGTLFGEMLTNPFGTIAFTVIYLLACLLIVRGGIKGGIEKFSNYAMPALFFMLLIIIIRAVTLPGAAEGLAFMFKPDFGYLMDNFGRVVSVAGCQIFFSLSIAMGIMVTYGSYVPKEQNLVKNTLTIIVFDTLVAMCAGLAVLPSAFALGGEGAAMAGPSLLFVTLQNVFENMGAIGPLFGAIFYALVFIAAITSTVSLIEVLITFFMDRAAAKQKQGNRHNIALWVCVAVAIEALLVAWDGLGSNGVWVPFQNKFGIIGSFNDCWLDFIDYFAEYLFMPIGAIMTAVMIGWVLKPKTVYDEVTVEGHAFKGYGFYKFCIRFVVPIVMLLVLISCTLNTFGVSVWWLDWLV